MCIEGKKKKKKIRNKRKKKLSILINKCTKNSGIKENKLFILTEKKT